MRGWIMQFTSVENEAWARQRLLFLLREEQHALERMNVHCGIADRARKQRLDLQADIGKSRKG